MNDNWLGYRSGDTHQRSVGSPSMHPPEPEPDPPTCRDCGKEMEYYELNGYQGWKCPDDECGYHFDNSP